MRGEWHWLRVFQLTASDETSSSANGRFLLYRTHTFSWLTTGGFANISENQKASVFMSRKPQRPVDFLRETYGDLSRFGPFPCFVMCTRGTMAHCTHSHVVCCFDCCLVYRGCRYFSCSFCRQFLFRRCEGGYKQFCRLYSTTRVVKLSRSLHSGYWGLTYSEGTRNPGGI